MSCIQPREINIDLSAARAAEGSDLYANPIAGAGAIRVVVSAPAGEDAVVAELTVPGRGDLVWPLQPGNPGSDCNFDFPNLTPGSYVLNLRVTGTDSDGVSGLRELSTPVQVGLGEQVVIKLDATKLVQPGS